jgi:Phage integrase SAM-like domain
MDPRFYLKTEEDKKGARELIIVYSQSNRYYKVNAGISRITETQWDKQNSCVINHTEGELLTTMIQKNLMTMKDIVNDYKYHNRGKNPSIDHVRTEYEKSHNENIEKEKEQKEKSDSKSDDIHYNYELFLKEKRSKIKAPAHYKLVGDNLKEFLKGQNIFLKDIDKEFLKNFVNFYLLKKKLAKTKQTNKPFDNKTINKRIKNFKGFLRWMENDKRRDVNPAYKDFKTDLVETEKRIVILDDKQFAKTVESEKYITLTKTLERVRDIYIIQCLTGLRYSDVKRIRSHMIKGNGRNKYLEIDVQKIKKIANLRIPLLPIAEKFLKKYNNDIPNISMDKFNQNAVELFKKLGFNEVIETKTIIGYQGDLRSKRPKYELLSSHSCRKFFVSFCVEKGVSDKQIMEWTGLSKIDTYHKYVKTMKIGEQKLRQGVSKLMKKRIKK